MKARFAAASAAAIWLLTAALPAHAWDAAPAGQPVAMKKAGWAIAVPDGWLYDTPSGHELAASRDGMFLNWISLALVPHKDAFKAVKRESRPDSLPEDLAESYVAYLKGVGGLYNDVEVISTDPAELAGRPAFRVHVKFRLPEALGRATFEQTTVGTALDAGLLLATFRAPSLHHYAKWLPEFDKALATVQPVAAPAAAGKR